MGDRSIHSRQEAYRESAHFIWPFTKSPPLLLSVPRKQNTAAPLPFCKERNMIRSCITCWCSHLCHVVELLSHITQYVPVLMLSMHSSHTRTPVMSVRI